MDHTARIWNLEPPLGAIRRRDQAQFRGPNLGKSGERILADDRAGRRIVARALLSGTTVLVERPGLAAIELGQIGERFDPWAGAFLGNSDRVVVARQGRILMFDTNFPEEPARLFGLPGNRWAAVVSSQNGERLYAWDGDRWRYEWQLFPSVKKLVSFSRNNLPRVRGGLQIPDAQQRCYYVELRTSEECENVKIGTDSGWARSH